jgi:hypothetical protein
METYEVAAGTYRKGDPGWEQARLGWNRLVERRPEIVVRATSVEEVRTAVSLARAEGLRLAVQSSGHGAGQGLGTLEGALLLDVSAMQRVEVDPQARTACCAAGATWQQVVEAAARFGLTGLAGSSPNVAVAGYTLGGGVSFLGRRYGLAANNVVAVDAVLSDGTVVRADEDHEPELFWALRGGGGSFAVVTALELRLFPVAQAYAGFLYWPIERAAELLGAWLEWSRDLSEDVGTVARVVQVPSFSWIPEMLRGRTLVGLDGAILGDDAEGVLQPLRDLKPDIDTFRAVPAPALTRIHLDPEPPLPGMVDGWVLDGFAHEGLEALLSAVPPATPSALVSIDLRHLGGALNRWVPGQGCAGAMAGDYAVIGVGMAMNPQLAALVQASFDLLQSALDPWLAPRQFPNFGARPDASAFFAPADLQRLRSIRCHYDPERLLLSNRRVD